jgi:DNA adenine methylase
MTSVGLVEIRDIKVGDMVLTHLGRYQKVLATGSKHAPSIIVRGQGHYGLQTTADHPFYATERKTLNTKLNGKSVYESWFEEPEWIEAKNLSGKHWAALTQYPSEPVPKAVCEGRESQVAQVDENLMWLAGAFVGDGWTRITERRSYTLYGVNQAKADAIIERVNACGLHATKIPTRTGFRIQVASGAIARWMRENFGHGADGKQIPTWLYGADQSLRSAFLNGYIAMDGTPIKGGHRIVSICRKLTLGTKMLAVSLGYSVSMRQVVPKRDRCVIEGRVVSERPYFTISLTKSSRTSFERGGYRFSLVRSVETSIECEVFNLEVEHDNTYCAEGIVVHNCQSFSLAGLRKGLSDSRGQLTMSFIALADVIDDVRLERGDEPAIIFWENVPGVLTHKDNPFGCFLAGLAGEDLPLEPPGGRWSDAGLVLGPQRAIAWRTLDAQFFGLAQRRRRVFVIASAREGFDPAEILFEREGLRRDSPPSREAGEGAARTLGASTGGASGKEQAYTFIGGDGQPLNPLDVSGGSARLDIDDLLGADTHTHTHQIQPGGMAVR